MKHNLEYDFNILNTNTRIFWVLVFCIISGFIIPFTLYAESSIPSIGRIYDAFWFYKSNTRAFSFAFSASLPLIAVLGNATVFLDEKRFLSSIFTRCKDWNYYFSKIIVTFFSGFIITFTFLSLNYLNSILLSGISNTNMSLNVFVVKLNNPILVNAMYVFPKLWTTFPHLNIIAYILLFSLLSGCISFATFGLSLLNQNKIFVYLGATLFSLTTAAVFNIVSSPIQLWYWINAFDPFPLTRFDTPASVYLYVMIFWLIFLFSFGISSIVYTKRQDVM